MMESMNWLQYVELMAAALPAVEQVSVEIAQLITSIAHAAAQAPPASHVAVTAAANTLANARTKTATSPKA